MASHFACIGVPTASKSQLNDFIDKIAKIADPIGLEDQCQLLVWIDSSGASIFLHMNAENLIDCLTPSFHGAMQHQVRLKGIQADEDCVFCDLLHAEVLDDRGEMVYPLLLQLEDIEIMRARLELETIAELRVTGFAETLRSWPDEQAFQASQAHQELQYATQSCGPSGMFNTPWTPHAFMTGKVKQSELLTNSESGLLFLHLIVESYGGTYDVVSAPPQEPIEPGAIVSCTCWMVGCLRHKAAKSSI